MYYSLFTLYSETKESIFFRNGYFQFSEKTLKWQSTGNSDFNVFSLFPVTFFGYFQFNRNSRCHILYQNSFLARLYEVKYCLCDIPGPRARALACTRDQNVQFLRLGQFLSNYKGQRLHTWYTLTSVDDQ